MAENKKQNRWTITLDDVVNFRNALLEDKFTEIPGIFVEKDEPKKEVFRVELPGYGDITISASSGRFTFVPYIGIADESTKFNQRFFSITSFQKVTEEFVNSHLELKPIQKEQPKKEKKERKQNKEGKKVHGKNEVGHILGTTADLIDKLFLQGVTEAELQEHGVTRTRYRSHFRHLQKKKAAFIEVKFEDGIYSARLLA